jgi:hypothetical protein
VSWFVKVHGFRVNREKFNLHCEFVHEDRLAALKLIEGTNSREDVEDGVVVFNAVVEHQWEGDVAVVSVDSLVSLSGFGVGIDGEELGGDRCGVHFVNL